MSLTNRSIPRKCIAVLTVFTFLFQVLFTSYAAAISSRDLIGNVNQLIRDIEIISSYENRRLSEIKGSEIEIALNSFPDAERAYSGDVQYKTPDYISANAVRSYPNIKWFFEKLKRENKSALHEPTMVPISVGDITTFIPVDQFGKMVGDIYVQNRYVQQQLRDKLKRSVISAEKYNAKTVEHQQLRYLYDQAFNFSKSSKAVQLSLKFGDPIPTSAFTRFNSTHDMIWPEYRVVNGERVLVPVVYLTKQTILEEEVKSHVLEFNGDANFASLNLQNVDISFRSNFVDVAGNFEANNSNIDFQSDDVKVIVDGSLSLLSSTLKAENNFALSAHSIDARTIVQHIDLGNKSRSFYGQITEISANGDIVLSAKTNANFAGVQIQAGDEITIAAGGDIYIGAVPVTEHFKGKENGYSVERSSVDYLQSAITAENTIKLIANGSITLDAAEIVSSSGHIEILAGMGIFITDQLAQYQSSKKGKIGKKTKVNESIYQTIAIRSLLDAGKGITLSSQFGDITMKAVDVTAGEGTQIEATNGGVNLLMTTETDHYSYSKVTEGTWTTSTKNKGHNIETGVPNSFIGGLQVEALKGVTVEYEGLDNEECKDYLLTKGLITEEACLKANLEALADMEGMSWMKDMLQDAESNPDAYNWEEVKLAHDTWNKSTRSLSPAAVAVITIAVAVATGPAAAGVSGAVSGSVAGAALSAGFTTLVNTAVLSLANGNSIDATLQSLSSDENMRSLAISMVTAGAIAQIDLAYFSVDKESLEAAKQAGSTISTASSSSQSMLSQLVQTTSHAATRAAITTIANNGSLEDFGQNFKTGMMQAGVDYLGQQLAQRIGNWHEGVNDFRQFDLSDVAQYISHAATGCLTGTLTAEINQSSPQQACSYGAAGGVIGEVTADIYKESTGYYELNAEGEKVRSLLEAELGEDFQYMTKEEMEALTPEQWKSLAGLNDIQDRLIDLRSTGTNLARLSAAMGAFVAGADAAYIHIAADTGANAAENNALFLLPLIKVGLAIWTAVELAQAAEELYNEINRYQSGEMSEEEKAELLQHIATEGGMALLDLLPAKKLERVLNMVRETKAGSIVEEKLTGIVDRYDARHAELRESASDYDMPDSRLPRGDYSKREDGLIVGPKGGLSRDTALNDKETGKPIFQRSSGGYYIVGEDGKQVTVASPREKGNYVLSDNVWSEDPKVRGKQIQAELNKTDYEDWEQTDDFINPKTNKPFKSENFPLIDFQKDDMVVSLKTVDTNGSTWKERMISHAREFDNPSKVLVDGKKPSVKILDIRVQPGGFNDAEEWVESVRDKFDDVQFVIKEFIQ